MPQLWTNNARALTLGAISAVDTAIVIESTKADFFPTANANGAAVSINSTVNWFKMTLQDTAGNIEIVHVRTRASGSNVLTNVIRAQEGTTARAFAVGSVVGLRFTAADLSALRGTGSTLEAQLRTDTGDDSGSGIVAFNYARNYSAGTVGKWLKDLALAAGSTFFGWIQAGASAVLRTISDKLRERVSVADFGAVGDGTDETAEILAAVSKALSDGRTLWWPKPITKYVYSTSIVLTDGIRMEGEGAPNRWRSSKEAVRIDYTGSGSAVTVAPGASLGADSIQLANLQFDGRNAAAGCHGLYLNATAASSYIEGVLAENSAFINFPGHQLMCDGTVFDVTMRRVTLMNPNKVADDLVRIQNGQPSQFNFDDCWLAQYTAAKWCIVAMAGDLRLTNGTIAPYAGGAGANGVLALGSLCIYGTHVENSDPTQTSNIGIQYLGSGGAFISPSECAYFGIGVQIGDGTATAARGWTLVGNVGNNNTGVGGYDVLITAGGARSGAIINIGFANGTPTILDNRFDIDGVSEVVRLENAELTGAKVYAEDGTDTLPGLSFRGASTRGFYNTGSGIGVATGGGQQAEFRGTDAAFRTRVCPGTPAGVIQRSAGIYGGTGAPSNADGGNGEFYFRSDGGALTTIYQKRTGAWVGIV